MESKSNKTSQIVCLIIGIIAFIAISLIQTKATRDGNSSLNGVFAQILVIISTLLVIISRKKGFVAGVVLNLVSVLPVTLQFVKSGNLGMLPGIIIPFCTIITIGIIYLFSSRTRKMHAELTESYNKIVEANRVMKEKDEKLSYLAYYDVLTNMPNRQLFIDKLEENIGNNKVFSVIYTDVDDFKRINDIYSHNAGDAMLCAFAERLQEICGERDFVARIGGDEFAIILNGTYSDVEINDYINRVRSLISEPVAVDGSLLHLTMSYGVVSYPVDCHNSEDILKCIDIAMFNAKASGKDRPCFYNRLQNNV